MTFVINIELSRPSLKRNLLKETWQNWGRNLLFAIVAAKTGGEEGEEKTPVEPEEQNKGHVASRQIKGRIKVEKRRLKWIKVDENV